MRKSWRSLFLPRSSVSLRLAGSGQASGLSHPELATAPDELLITYAANAWGFWDLFKEARLYWPRFVRVNLSAK
jgi:hypothetical protein